MHFIFFYSCKVTCLVQGTQSRVVLDDDKDVLQLNNNDTIVFEVKQPITPPAASSQAQSGFYANLSQYPI